MSADCIRTCSVLRSQCFLSFINNLQVLHNQSQRFLLLREIRPKRPGIAREFLFEINNIRGDTSTSDENILHPVGWSIFSYEGFWWKPFFPVYSLRYIESICKHAYFVNFSSIFLLSSMTFISFRIFGVCLRGYLHNASSSSPGLTGNGCFEEVISEKIFRFICVRCEARLVAF